MKKIWSKILTIAMTVMLVGSISAETILANHSDSTFSFAFDESSGEYQHYTDPRVKEDDTAGWIRSYSSNRYCFRASLAGYLNWCYMEDFGPYGGLNWTTVKPGYGYYLKNYVYEFADLAEIDVIYAVIKGESTVGTRYSVTFDWSPDSI